MYAIVATGGKQVKVQEGQVVQVERLGEPGSEVNLRPVMLVEGGEVITSSDSLAKASVSARILEEVKGKKIHGFTYKSKTNNRRRFGHRQIFSKIEITGISKG